MKIFRRKKKPDRVRREIDGQSGLSNLPPTFKLCVKYFLDNDPMATIQISRRATMSNQPLHVGYMELRVAWEVADIIESALAEEYGGGIFSMNFRDAGGKHFAAYNFAVEGPLKRKGSDGSGGGGKSTGDDILRTLALSNIDATGEKAKNIAEAESLRMQTTINLLASQNQGGGMMEEMLTILMNNAFVEKSSAFENAISLVELINRQAPQVQGQDGLAAIISGVVPLLTTLIASKTGGGGGITAESISNILNALPEGDQKTALLTALRQPPQATRLPIQVGASPEQMAGKIPRPYSPGLVEVSGSFDDPDMTSSAVEVPAGGDPAVAPADASPDSLVYVQIVTQLLSQFQNDILNSVHPGNLAKKLITLIQMCQTYLGKATPPPLTGLAMNQDEAQSEAEFDAFCERVPELASRPQLCMMIKLHLAQILIGEDLEPEPDDGAEVEEAVIELDHDKQEQPDEGGPTDAEQDRPDSPTVDGNDARAQNAAG